MIAARRRYSTGSDLLIGITWLAADYLPAWGAGKPLPETGAEGLSHQLRSLEQSTPTARQADPDLMVEGERWMEGRDSRAGPGRAGPPLPAAARQALQERS